MVRVGWRELGAMATQLMAVFLSKVGAEHWAKVIEADMGHDQSISRDKTERTTIVATDSQPPACSAFLVV